MARNALAPEMLNREIGFGARPMWRTNFSQGSAEVAIY
jgi:hypothetical protein